MDHDRVGERQDLGEASHGRLQAAEVAPADDHVDIGREALRDRGRRQPAEKLRGPADADAHGARLVLGERRPQRLLQVLEEQVLLGRGHELEELRRVLWVESQVQVVAVEGGREIAGRDGLERPVEDLGRFRAAAIVVVLGTAQDPQGPCELAGDVVADERDPAEEPLARLLLLAAHPGRARAEAARLRLLERR